MEVKEIGNSVKLTPSEGMYLYDGKHVVSVIHAPNGADLSEW